MLENNAIVRFFKRVFRIIKLYLITIGLLVTIGYAFFLYSLYSWRAEGPSFGITSSLEDSVLMMDLEGTLTHSPPNLKSRIFANLTGSGPNVYLSQVRDALERAAEDKRIRGVLLDLTKLSGGLTHYAEVHRSLKKYLESEKDLYVHSLSYDVKKYYLGSLATQMSLPPLGSLELLGPTSQLVYFAGALDKLGVHFEVFKAGKYKSAFEPFVANQPSAPTLEEYKALNNSLEAHLYAQIAEGRDTSPDVVHSWFKRSIFSASDAVSQRIVDATVYKTQLLEELKTKYQVTNTVDYVDYLPMSRNVLDKDIGSKEHGIAYIEASGEVWVASSADGPEDDNINIDNMRKRLKWAREHENVKAVLLHIDSPGGSALASEIIWHEVHKLSEKKPVVVLMGRVAASGGYYIASAAQKIIAEPTTITGSIGVIGMVPNLKKFEDKYGVHFYVVSNSDRKDLINAGKAATAQDKAILSAGIDEVYQTFLQRVADNRKMSRDQVHGLAQGRIYTGVQAKEVGLVDELGGLKTAFREAKVLAELDPEKSYRVFHYQDHEFNLVACLRKYNLTKCLAKASKQTRGLISRPKSWLGKMAVQAQDMRQRLSQGERTWALWLGTAF